MKKTVILLVVCTFVATTLSAENIKPTKNIIVMIPDGTSLSVLSASRWLQTFRNQGNHLKTDPYISGTVTTFSSNAPIGDSAPTTSCYLTGMPQQAGNVAIYPLQDKGNDLIPINPDSAYQPLITIPEAMKIYQQKAMGLVVTCEFPHATPADCAAHTYNRSDYQTIAKQMAYNRPDVLIGGGNDFLPEKLSTYLQQAGTTIVRNDKKALLNFGGEKIWALFDKEDMPFDIDRDTAAIPSLSEMTSKALELLSKNNKGFFLLVEGSKVDWAAHANDPIAIMTEFLAFDKAVGVAMDYARKAGNTTVIVLPDHGNSGFSIGRNNLKKTYTRMTLEDLFGSVSKYQRTATGLESILHETDSSLVKQVFHKYTGIDLTPEEERKLQQLKSIRAANYSEVKNTVNLVSTITSIMNDRSTFGFTTGGHTGEEVFLASYHPKSQVLKGNVTNQQINQYLFLVSGLKKSLKACTAEIYNPHPQLFEGMKYSIEKDSSGNVQLVVLNNNHQLVVPANSSEASIDGKTIKIGSVAVYIDKTNLFYVPKTLGSYLK